MTKPKRKLLAEVDNALSKIDRKCKYRGKLGTIPAMFVFRRDYCLSVGLKVEYKEDSAFRPASRWQEWETGIVDAFHPGCIFISKL